MNGFDYGPPLDAGEIEGLIDDAVETAVGDIPEPPNEDTIRLWAREEAQSLLDAWTNPPLPVPRTVVEDTSLVANDLKAGSINVNSSQNLKITVPDNLPTGGFISLNQLGSGPFDLVAGGQSVIDKPAGYQLRSSGPNSVVTLSRISETRWLAGGALLPVDNGGGNEKAARWPNGEIIMWDNGSTMEF